MRVETLRDLDAGTVTVIMRMHITADTDRMADLAFETVDVEMQAAKLAAAHHHTLTGA